MALHGSIEHHQKVPQLAAASGIMLRVDNDVVQTRPAKHGYPAGVTANAYHGAKYPASGFQLSAVLVLFNPLL
jgi:hypothetical protein